VDTAVIRDVRFVAGGAPPAVWVLAVPSAALARVGALATAWL